MNDSNTGQIMLDAVILSLQDPSNMQLHMGELSRDELLVAKAAVRYTATQLKSLGLVNQDSLNKLLH